MKEEGGEGRRGDESASSPNLFSTAAEKGSSSTKPLPCRNGEGVGDGAIRFRRFAFSFLLFASSGFVGQIINHINLGDDAAHSI